MLSMFFCWSSPDLFHVLIEVFFQVFPFDIPRPNEGSMHLNGHFHAQRTIDKGPGSGMQYDKGWIMISFSAGKFGLKTFSVMSQVAMHFPCYFMTHFMFYGFSYCEMNSTKCVKCC